MLIEQMRSNNDFDKLPINYKQRIEAIKETLIDIQKTIDKNQER